MSLNALVFVLLQITSPATFLNQVYAQEVEHSIPLINSYSNVSQEIINFLTQGPGRHQTFNQLARLTDKFGNRFVGTENLENAIDYMLSELKASGFENVHGETVPNIPHWVRGKESASLLEPRHYNMSILGLGSSIGTPPEGITAEAIVVHSFDELHSRSLEVGLVICVVSGFLQCTFAGVASC